MAGLGKGLTKNEQHDVTDQNADDFIKSASDKVDSLKPTPKTRVRVYKTYTFSLTEIVSKDIDELSLVPRTFKVNRSDVIKAGVQQLKKLSDKQLIELLNEVKQVK